MTVGRHGGRCPGHRVSASMPAHTTLERDGYVWDIFVSHVETLTYFVIVGAGSHLMRSEHVVSPWRRWPVYFPFYLNRLHCRERLVRSLRRIQQHTLSTANVKLMAHLALLRTWALGPAGAPISGSRRRVGRNDLVVVGAVVRAALPRL